MWVGVIQILLPSGVCRLWWMVVWICGLCAGGWVGCLGFLFGDLVFCGLVWVLRYLVVSMVFADLLLGYGGLDLWVSGLVLWV